MVFVLSLSTFSTSGLVCQTKLASVSVKHTLNHCIILVREQKKNKKTHELIKSGNDNKIREIIPKGKGD